MDQTLREIGVVRSSIKDRKAMPAFGVPAAVELHPAFGDALLRIEKHSHFWVMAWLMGRPERDVLQVVPRGVEPGQPDAMHGVFAVRSPARPNPIGLTAARLLQRDGLVLHFDCLDFLDGTMVVDLKPYFVSRDLIYSARNLGIGRPRDAAALREGLWWQVRRHMGEASHPDVERAVALMEDFRIEVMAWREPERWSITVPLHRPELADALVAMTRVRMAQGLGFTGEDHVNVNGYRYQWTGEAFERR